MPETVLYVDDDTTNLKVLAATLKPSFHVICAEGGEEALGVLGREEVAVLVTDQRMPRMSGVDLLEATAREHPDVVRILVTAYADLDAAIGAINRGRVSRYIRKPWTPEELRAVIGEAADVFRTRAQLRLLEQRLRETERVYAVGVVAASVAHDLRNPLMVAQTSLQKARKMLLAQPAAGGSEATAHVEKVARAVEQIGEIVAGMELSQRRTQATTTADLAEVVRLTLSFLQGALRKRGALQVYLEPVPRVVGSPTALGQVVLNLLVNALEALPEDDDAAASVIVRLRRDGTSAVVEVEDTGAGIAPEVLDRIFDPFFSTKTEGSTGLGLAISKRIVDEVGGTLGATSTPGKGSCFTVRLPLAPEA
jgi:signal transduction histidine kinase